MPEQPDLEDRRSSREAGRFAGRTATNQPAMQAPADGAPLADRLTGTPGLATLVGEAEATWRARALAAGDSEDAESAKPGWRSFEDSFPTFYEFTNRPR